MEVGLTPGQAGYFDLICRRAAEARATGQGRTLFVSGEELSGRSHLLAHANDRLARGAHGVRVVKGNVVSGRYAAEVREQSSGPVGSALSVLSTAIPLGEPVLGPAFKLVLQLAQLASAAGTAMEELEAQGASVDLPDVLSRLVRAAVRERPHEPLVCLVDDADLFDWAWWVDLQFSFAEEIATKLPLVLVLVVDGPVDLAAGGSAGESKCLDTARGLVERDLADWCGLTRVDAAALDAWLGGVSPALAEQVLRNVEGLPGDLTRYWSALRKGGAIELGDVGWRLVKPLSRVEHEPEGLTRRLAARLRSDDANTVDLVRQVLAYGALEGDVFTAEAIAAACDRGRDEVNDLLDELCKGGPDGAIVEELGSIEIASLARDTSYWMWRYRFLRPLDRRVLRAKVRDGGDHRRMAAALAAALERLYAHDVRLVSHVIARLYREAGDARGAARMHRMARRVVSQATLDSQCRHLMSATTATWRPVDFREACRLLVEGCYELEGVWPYDFALAVAERAEQFARNAGESGALQVGEALRFRGHFAGRMGSSATAMGCLEEAFRRALPANQKLQAEVFLDLGHLLQHFGPDFPAARIYLREAVRLCRRIGWRNAEGTSWYMLAQADIGDNELEAALPSNREAHRIARGERNARDEASCLYQAALIAFLRGEPEQAETLVKDSLKLHRELGDGNEAPALWLLGSLEFEAERFDVAKAQVAASLAMDEKARDASNIAESLRTLARIELASGDRDVARQCLTRALAVYERIGDTRRVGYCRNMLAELS